MDFAAEMSALHTARGVSADELPRLAEGIMRLAEDTGNEAERICGEPPPRCHPCSRTSAEGRDRNAPAAYWWIYDDGMQVPLCVRCCANWRENLVRDPESYCPPVRIRQVSA